MFNSGIKIRYRKTLQCHVFIFRVVVHSIISISRMKFLVKRWKKTKKTVKKAWSQDAAGGRPDSELSEVGQNMLATEELEPGVNFAQN